MGGDFPQRYWQNLPLNPCKTVVCEYKHCYGHVYFSEHFELQRKKWFVFPYFLPSYLISNLKPEVSPSNAVSFLTNGLISNLICHFKYHKWKERHHGIMEKTFNLEFEELGSSPDYHLLTLASYLILLSLNFLISKVGLAPPACFIGLFWELNLR